MDEKRLSHTSWNCKYHIVLVPKYRRKTIYGKLRKDIGKILRMLCDYKHFQAVFVAFLCRGSDIILVTLEPCISPILKVQDRVQLDTADKRILILFQFELDLLLSLAIEGLEARRTIFLVAVHHT